MSETMRPHILIGTYHKSGTVWAQRFCKLLAQRTGAKLVNISDAGFYDSAGDLVRKSERICKAATEGQPTIVFDWHSRFPDVAASFDYRGFRVVRDPRDIAISGANYHGWSKEEWLHRPCAEFKNASYQQAMKDLDLSEAIHFELDHAARTTIEEMLGFDGRGRFRTELYEDLMVQRRADLLTAISKHLAVPDRLFRQAFKGSHETQVALERKINAGVRSHIQDGGAQQWRYLFDLSHIEHFNDRFPRGAERLGYLPTTSDQLRIAPVQKLSYESRFWANRARYDEAIAIVGEVLKIARDAASLEWLGVLFDLAGQPDRAAAMLKESLELNGRAATWQRLAQVYESMGSLVLADDARQNAKTVEAKDRAGR